MNTNRMGKIMYNGIDLMKFIMAIVIVSIHAQLYTVLGRWYLVFQDHAVPLFFVFSSFFFFKKIRYAGSWKEQWNSLMYFEKRINLLYLFWILALVPAILYWWHSEYMHLPPVDLLLLFMKEYFLGSQFGAAWFLGSLIVATPIVLCTIIASTQFKKWGGIIIFLTASFIYIYLNECEECSLYRFYEETFRSPRLSFPIALWWLTLGYFFSDTKVELILKWLGTKKAILLWGIFFAIGCIFPTIRYLTVAIGVVALFALSINLQLNDNPAIYRRLRIYSIHIFVMHFTIILIISYFLRDHVAVIFALTVVLCIAISEILIRLMAYSPFKWLIYSK